MWNITADCMTSDDVSLVSFFHAVKAYGENHHEVMQLKLEQPATFHVSVNSLIISAM